MPIIEWNDDLLLGIEEIDSQHIHLYNSINAFGKKIMAGFSAGEVALKKMANTMVKYAEDHFHTEEKYFKEFHYEHTKEHIARHNEFRKKANELKALIEQEQQFLAIDTMNFLLQWFYTHVKQDDKNYVKFLKDHGVT